MFRFPGSIARVASPMALLAAVLMAQPASAGLVLFNPSGTGTSGTSLQVQTFDELPGNALAQGAQALITNAINTGGTGGAPLAVGQSATTAAFTLYYQANVQLIGPDGTTSYNTGSDIVTVVAKFQETATVTGGSNTVTFNLASNQGGSYFDFFSHAKGGGSNANGTGFASDNGGTLIYSATPGTSGPSGNFTNEGGSTNLNQNLKPGTGQQTVNGFGGSNITFSTSYFNSNYFTSNPGSSITFQANNNLPFENGTAPSSSFESLSGSGTNPTLGSPIAPMLGSLNGSTGPDVQFLSDGSSFFPNAAVVPEPASVVMTFLGLGGMAFGSIAAGRRRRAQG